MVTSRDFTWHIEHSRHLEAIAEYIAPDIALAKLPETDCFGPQQPAVCSIGTSLAVTMEVPISIKVHDG